MRFIALFLGTLFLLTNIAFSQNEQVRSFPMEDRALLWQITGPEVSGTSYLFGTMHMIDKDIYFFPRKLEKAFKRSDLLVTEITDISNSSEELKDKMLLEEGDLFDMFTEEQADSIFMWAEAKMGVKESGFRTLFSKFKPIVIVQLAVQLNMKGDYESYELNFEKLAKENDIKQEGLETAEEQLAIFDGLTKEQSIAMVMESIKDDEATRTLHDSMNQAYIEQNIDGLYHLITDQQGVLEALEKQLLTDRNNKWTPKIEEYLKTNNVFIAVGAGHLGGPEGVIRLLEKEGYTLTPIKL